MLNTNNLFIFTLFKQVLGRKSQMFTPTAIQRIKPHWHVTKLIYIHTYIYILTTMFNYHTDFNTLFGKREVIQYVQHHMTVSSF